MSGDGGKVRTRVRGHVFEVVFDRPERRNALSPALWEGLEKALDKLDGLADVTVMTLSGAGGYFCVGGDLKALQDGSSHFSGDATSRMALLQHEQAVVRRLAGAPVLTVAKIDGAATGGGFDLALACDIRVATPSAKLGAVFVKIGLVPDLGGLFLLERLVGHATAATMALTGRILDGAAAYQVGLVQAVAEDGDLDEAARPWVDAAAAAKPYALRRIKAAMVRNQLAHGEAMATELAATQAILLSTPEFAEALAAFGARGKGG